MGLLQDAYNRVFTADGLNKTFADPRFQIGAGLLGRNDMPIGQAIGGTMNDYMRYQAMNQQYQAQQAAMAAAQEKVKREEEERQRQMQARAEVSKLFPQIGPVLDAYPNAAPQILASQYRSPTEAPSNVREWEYFNKLNDAQKQQYLTMKRANQIIDRGPEYVIPNPANPQMPMASIPKDLNPGERPDVRAEQAAAVDTAKAAVEKRSAMPKAKNALGVFERQTNVARENIKEIQNLYGPMTAWTPDFIANLPQSKARAIQNKLQAIKANIGFQALQEMRANSPTGGALGQVAVQELEGLQSTLGTMDWRDSEFIPTLMRIDEILAGMAEQAKSAFESDYGIQANGGWSIKKVD